MKTAKTSTVVPSLIATIATSPRARAAEVAKPVKRLGVGMHSYGFHWNAGKQKHPQAKFNDALTFLSYCHSLGAGGVQVTLGTGENGYANKLRAEAEKCGMYLEAQCSLPREEPELARFEKEVQCARDAGAKIMRTACMGGRRYEVFSTAADFQRFSELSWKSLQLVEPVLRRHRIKLAVENHKDWRVPELVDVMRRLSSEWVGVTVDTGNSIALLEDPMDVVEALAPFAVSTHLKDMAVQEYEDGFLLSEVPLGEGFLDLKRMIDLCTKANPEVQFNLEMITRDPLKIPCLGPKYWVTMQMLTAQQLARALALVKNHPAAEPLPMTTGKKFEEQLAFENENVVKSIAYSREHLGLG